MVVFWSNYWYDHGLKFVNTTFFTKLFSYFNEKIKQSEVPFTENGYNKRSKSVFFRFFENFGQTQTPASKKN